MLGLRYLPDVVTLVQDQEKCIGCTRCVQVCPHNVLTIKNQKSHITDLDACMECGACARNCPTGALDVHPGVGCAAGIIMGAIRGTEPTCDCSDSGCC